LALTMLDVLHLDYIRTAHANGLRDALDSPSR
jgi:ABC-type dipeptide/oligopeptide/nickel transport system permease component